MRSKLKDFYVYASVTYSKLGMFFYHDSVPPYCIVYVEEAVVPFMLGDIKSMSLSYVECFDNMDRKYFEIRGQSPHPKSCVILRMGLGG